MRIKDVVLINPSFRGSSLWKVYTRYPENNTPAVRETEPNLTSLSRSHGEDVRCEPGLLGHSTAGVARGVDARDVD
jgi:hypothetical protein